MARANILAAESKKVAHAEIINIGSGIETSVNEIAREIGGEIVHMPPRIEPRSNLADISRARELIGFAPQVSLAEGIEELKKLASI